MKGQTRNAVTAAKAEKAGPTSPNVQERLTSRQIEAAQIHRRAGLREQEIADLMGISLSSVSRHTRGIKPKKANGEGAAEKASLSIPVAGTNGGEPPVLAPPKPTEFQVKVDLDPQLVLLLAGDAARLGYSSVTRYIQEYNIPWVTATAKGADIIGAKTPQEFEQKLLDIAKDALAFRKMVKESQKEAEKTVVKRE